MIKEYKNREIPLDIFTVEHKEYLLKHNFIGLAESGYFLTNKGNAFIQEESPSELKVVYPLMTKGRVKSYNNVIASMTDNAANALICAMINKGFFAKVNTSNTRVLMQHLLDSNINTKMGETLIRKYHSTMQESINYFDKKKTRCIA